MNHMHSQSQNLPEQEVFIKMELTLIKSGYIHYRLLVIKKNNQTDENRIFLAIFPVVGIAESWSAVVSVWKQSCHHLCQTSSALNISQLRGLVWVSFSSVNSFCTKCCVKNHKQCQNRQCPIHLNQLSTLLIISKSIAAVFFVRNPRSRCHHFLKDTNLKWN